MTPTDIADEIWSTQKIRVDRRKIDLDETIKRVGVHTVPIRIFEDVSTEVRTVVVPEGGELPSEDEIAAWEAEERAEAEPEEAEVEGAEELEALLAEEAPEPVAEAAEGEADTEVAAEPEAEAAPEAEAEAGARRSGRGRGGRGVRDLVATCSPACAQACGRAREVPALSGRTVHRPCARTGASIRPACEPMFHNGCKRPY